MNCISVKLRVVEVDRCQFEVWMNAAHSFSSDKSITEDSFCPSLLFLHPVLFLLQPLLTASRICYLQMKNWFFTYPKKKLLPVFKLYDAFAGMELHVVTLLNVFRLTVVSEICGHWQNRSPLQLSYFYRATGTGKYWLYLINVHLRFKVVKKICCEKLRMWFFGTNKLYICCYIFGSY